LKKDKGGIRISTDSFTLVSLKVYYGPYLLDKYGIQSTRYAKNQDKGQYIIRIPKRELPKVQELVKPFIPPCMAKRVGVE